MLVLALRTDKPEAELYLYKNQQLLGEESWQAHRQLAETIHLKIEALLTARGFSIKNINGLLIYEGPGSFTGLRIGMSVVNALAYSLQVPIVAAHGEDWLKTGLKRLSAGKNNGLAMPNYGSSAHITKPKR